MSSPISNVFLTDTVEFSGDDDIQFVYRSLFKNVGKEVFSQLLDLCKYNYEARRRSSSVLNRSKVSNLLYNTFASAIAKSCRSPCASRTTATALK